ncbi:MAG: glycosyltransferase [bacterium]|nr:glycosyltransferase [bacterium]
MMDNTTPFVSVIIPVLNGERTIRECLVSLLKMDYPQERREILVVDNGSTDSTAEIVKSFPVRYLREERRGASYARNRGIEASTGEIVAFIDADCTVTTLWLRELVQGFDAEDVGVVGGELVAYPPKTSAERYFAMRKPLWHTRTINYPISPWFLSGNTAFRREVFDQVGLFDPQFVACEDIDYSWRFFQNKNFKLIYRSKAVVFHRHRLTTWELFKQYRRYGLGQAILRRKYQKELSWGWKREFRAYGDLLLAVVALGRAAILSMIKGRETTRFSYLYCDLACKLGARVGFISGTLRRGAGYG